MINKGLHKEFLGMIQQVVSSTSSFTGNLEFISESNLPLVGFDVCHPKHLLYISYSHREELC